MGLHVGRSEYLLAANHPYECPNSHEISVSLGHQPTGGDEPPPRDFARRRTAVRERLLRSTVPGGGGRSP